LNKIGDLTCKELGMRTCHLIGSLIFFRYYISAQGSEYFDFEISLFWRYTEFVIFTCRCQNVYDYLHAIPYFLQFLTVSVSVNICLCYIFIP
jgi:hypothetical protein